MRFQFIFSYLTLKIDGPKITLMWQNYLELEDEDEDLIENLSQELNGYEENDGQNLTEITTIKEVLFSWS